MVDKEQGRVPESLYKYLLTIARRSGMAEVRIRILMTNSGRIALLKGGGGNHLLPCCDISGESEGEEMEGAVKHAVERTGLDFSCISRYLGSRDVIKGDERMKCFDFEVEVKGKARGVLWVSESGMAKLRIPEEEKKALKGCFVRRRI